MQNTKNYWYAVRRVFISLIFTTTLICTIFGMPKDVMAGNVQTLVLEQIEVKTLNVEPSNQNYAKEAVVAEEVTFTMEEEVIPEENEMKFILEKEKEIKLAGEITTKLETVNVILGEITSKYTAENASMVEQAKTSLDEIHNLLKEDYEGFKELWAEYEETSIRLSEYEKMITSLKTKLSKLEISESADMAKTVGFTVEELEYVLRNATCNGEYLVQDEELIHDLANAVVAAAEEEPINEILAISVMSLESGYFTSNLVKNYNNFGGMLYNGQAMTFENRVEGIDAAVRCIHRNLKGNNTVIDINKTYCPPVEGEGYFWATNVLYIMRDYVATFDL